MDDEKQESEREIDWDDYVRREEHRKRNISLEGKDYVALFIAALQTIFLPLIIALFVTVVVAIGLVFLIP
ncbi:MAG: hypothetical protein ACOC38_04210 [Promethearchaeia archaeon]